MNPSQPGELELENEDGTFTRIGEVPEETKQWVRDYAAKHGLTPNIDQGQGQRSSDTPKRSLIDRALGRRK